LHGKRDTFLEVVDDNTANEKEKEANRFAADILIPPMKCIDWNSSSPKGENISVSKAFKSSQMKLALRRALWWEDCSTKNYCLFLMVMAKKEAEVV